MLCIPSYASALKGSDMLKTCHETIELADTPQSRDTNCSDCEGTRNEVSPKAQCYGFIAGARLLGRLYENESPEARLFCIPYGVQNEQLARIYVKYLEQHPEQLHLNASSLLMECFKNAFPCGM
jgi:hypothetical protein